MFKWIQRNFSKAVSLLGRPFLRIHPLGTAVFRAEPTAFGTGPEWAKEVYGEYYARSVPVYAAVKLRADSVVRPPLLVMQSLADGSKERVPPSHPLQLLLDRANPWWTKGDVLRATSTYLDLWGSAFWVLTKTSDNAAPTEIWPVRPDNMRIVTGRDYIQGYIWQRGRFKIPLRMDEVIWFRNFNPLDEVSGLSPVGVGRLSLDMGIEALRYNRKRFTNDLMVSQLVLSSPDILTDEQARQLMDRLKAKYGGVEQSNVPMVLGNHFEAKNLGFSPRDMEHIQTLRWTVEDVSRIWQIPSIMLGDLEHSTYANVDAAERIFWRSMSTYLVFIQEEITELLAPMFGEGLSVEFDLSHIEALQENADLVANRDRLDVASGLVTINEIRDKRHLPSVPWGDSWWISIAQVPVSDDSTPMAPIVEESYAQYKRWKPEALSDGVITRLQDVHIKRLDRFTRRFDETQISLFNKQRVDVIRRLRASDHFRAWSKAITRQGVGEVLFDPADWQQAFTRAGLPIMQFALSDAANEVIADFALGVAFDVNRPVVQEWLVARSSFWAGRVNEETARLIVSEVQDAIALGESIKQMQERVEKVFKFNNAIRSERIARTEIQNAVNEGAIQAYEQSGVVDKIMWLTTLDGRERDAHREAHRQTVTIGTMFEVGGEMIPHPGAGSPENGINCRCRTAPVIERGQKSLRAPSRASSNGTAHGSINGNGHRDVPGLEHKTIRIHKEINRDRDGFASSIDETHVTLREE